MGNIKLIKPHWNVPHNVKAFSTTRIGGYSQGAYQGLNLGMHVDDAPDIVLRNRGLLPLSRNIQWLNQTHSTEVTKIDVVQPHPVNADASFTDVKNLICAVMTADCLPILLCNSKGTEVAAVHAGWRGIAFCIIEKAVKHMSSPAEELIAWLGPAIGSSCFEVGSEVFSRFSSHEKSAFLEGKERGRYFLDIYALASLKLAASGVSHIFSSNYCTYSQPEDFFSYRRDKVTGRMVSCVWLE